MKKAGAFITGLIISVISLVVALIVILGFYRGFPFYEGIDKEACHQSILLRGTIRPSVGLAEVDVGPRIVPLNCKTEKICISIDGEACVEFPKPSRENPVTEVKLSSGPKTQTLDKISDSLYECHDMLGRGLLNFVPDTFTSENYCLICSRIAFDEKARTEVPDITYGELFRYMQQKKNSEGESYLHFVYGLNDWSSTKTIYEELKTENPRLPQDYTLWKLSPSSDRQFAIVAQMSQKGRLASITTGALTAIGVYGITIFIPVVGPYIAYYAAVGSGAAVFLGTTPGVNYDYTPPNIIPYNVDTLRTLGCTSFETAP